MTDETPLPTVLAVTQAFSSRLPRQRDIDLLARIEPIPFAEIAQSQPFRLVAFRALIAQYPGRDATSLWMHSYDCECEVVESDPFNGNGLTPSPPSATTSTASPAT